MIKMDTRTCAVSWNIKHLKLLGISYHSRRGSCHSARGFCQSDTGWIQSRTGPAGWLLVQKLYQDQDQHSLCHSENVLSVSTVEVGNLSGFFLHWHSQHPGFLLHILVCSGQSAGANCYDCIFCSSKFWLSDTSLIVYWPSSIRPVWQSSGDKILIQQQSSGLTYHHPLSAADNWIF